MEDVESAPLIVSKDSEVRRGGLCSQGNGDGMMTEESHYSESDRY